MSFKSYATSQLPDGSSVLTDPQPLVLSGRHGLIARFVLGAPKRAAERWALCPGELQALAAPPLMAGERMIVFEQAKDAALEVLALETIHGISSDRTDMMFAFRPLRVLERSPAFRVGDAPGRRTYMEELALEGGVHAAPSANWRWREAHLALGGVICRR